MNLDHVSIKYMETLREHVVVASDALSINGYNSSSRVRRGLYDLNEFISHILDVKYEARLNPVSYTHLTLPTTPYV